MSFINILSGEGNDNVVSLWESLGYDFNKSIDETMFSIFIIRESWTYAFWKLYGQCDVSCAAVDGELHRAIKSNNIRPAYYEDLNIMPEDGEGDPTRNLVITLDKVSTLFDPGLTGGTIKKYLVSFVMFIRLLYCRKICSKFEDIASIFDNNPYFNSTMALLTLNALSTATIDTPSRTQPYYKFDKFDGCLNRVIRSVTLVDDIVILEMQNSSVRVADVDDIIIALSLISHSMHRSHSNKSILDHYNWSLEYVNLHSTQKDLS